MRLTKLLIAIVFLTFCGAAAGRAQTSEPPVKALGTFMRITSDGEHDYGYDVELWRQGERIFGLISAHDGLIGDPPTGLLENVQFNPQTRKFSFTAKMSLGVNLDKDYKSIPTREVFEFEGFLTTARLVGNLVINDKSPGDKSREKKKLNLPRSKSESRTMDEYKTFAEWKAWADFILDIRGPKW